MGTSITFDELERNGEKTFAYALLVKAATTRVVTMFLMYMVAGSLEHLIKALSPERLRSLTDEQRASLKLMELHKTLLDLFALQDIDTLRTKPFFGSVISRIEENTENLGDLIENIELGQNPEFRTLVSDCIASLDLK